MNSQKGQVLVVVLLVMLVGLTVGMGLVSRTTQDIAISGRVGESTQALSAAEAGIEQAIKNPVSITGSVAPGISYDVAVTIYGGTNNPYPPSPLITSHGDSMTFWLVNHDATGNLVEVPTYTDSTLDLCWGEPASAFVEQKPKFSFVSTAYAQLRTPPPGGSFPPGPGIPPPSQGSSSTPALVATLFYKDMPSGLYKTAYAALDSDSTRASGNKFDSSGISGSGGNCGSLKYKKTLTFSTFGGIASGINPAVDVLITLRVQTVYADAPLAISPAGFSNLPQQGMEIISRGTVGSINRQIRVVQNFDSPESFLDIPVYARGGSLVKN